MDRKNAELINPSCTTIKAFLRHLPDGHTVRISGFQVKIENATFDIQKRPRRVVFLIIIPFTAATLDRAYFRTIELDRDIEKRFPEQS